MTRSLVIFFTTVGATLLLLISVSKAQDINACPFPIKITQVDGSKLTIIGLGNMFISYTESIDSFTLVKNTRDIYEFAKLSPNGDLIPSGVRARDPRSRTKKQRIYLKNKPKHLRYTGEKLLELQEKSQNFKGQ